MKRIFFLVIISICAACSSRDRGTELDPIRRAMYTKEADFIFEGALTGVGIISEPTAVDAVEKHPDPRYYVTFSILAPTKGSFKKESFRIAVHSPAQSFYVYPSEYAHGNKKRYRIYIASKPAGTMIARELVAPKK